MIYWRSGGSTYEFEPNHNFEFARITIKHPQDPRDREYFIPKKLLDLYVAGRVHVMIDRLLESK